MVGEMESITTHETSTNETNTDNVTDLAKNAQLYKSIGIGTAVAIFLAMMLYLIICFACCNGAEKVGKCLVYWVFKHSDIHYHHSAGSFSSQISNGKNNHKDCSKEGRRQIE